MNPDETRRALQTADGWFKSSASGSNGGCVEVNLTGVPGAIGLRDTKLGAESPILAFTPEQWSTFLTEVDTDRLANENGAVTVTTRPDVWKISAADSALTFDRIEWDAFRTGIHAGEFAL